MSDTLLESIQIDTAPNPTVSIIWMHGLGADGSDFVPIVRELDLSGCPAIRFIFPHAQMMPVTMNGGYVMRSWYDILLGEDLTRREDEGGLRQSQQSIEQLIAHEKARGIPSNRILLAGFSQGCAMTLQTGLRHSEPLGGLLCLSGYLTLADKVAEERNPANQSTPIFMAHGLGDPVIPMQRARDSKEILQQLGYQVEWHEYPMQHSVCMEEIDDISAWLKRVLA